MVPSKAIEHKASRVIFPPANTRETSGLTNLLNKQLLLKNCCAAMPNHLSMATISGHGLIDVRTNITIVLPIDDVTFVCVYCM